MDLSPDGRFGYVPERDQDTVAMLDTDTLKISRRVEFPEGSRPWMLRASPNGREVWVQTASGSNVVLDAQTLETLHAEELGKQPVTASKLDRTMPVSRSGPMASTATWRSRVRTRSLWWRWNHWKSKPGLALVKNPWA